MASRHGSSWKNPRLEMNLKHTLKKFTPPVIVDLVRSTRQQTAAEQQEPVRFVGNYGSWEEAARASAGYAAPEIFARTRAAMHKVKNGEAAFERDSVTFIVMEHPFPLLAGLLRVAVQDKGRLSVLDFGGSLGSSYFQSRALLSSIKELRWSVVEQSEHVACGREEFADKSLRFYETVEECVCLEHPNVLLLSSVLAYLPRPYEFLHGVLAHAFSHVIVERTGFMSDGSDRLTVQHVPEWIYPATYPAWFLSEMSFRKCFQPRYDLVCDYAGADCVHPEGGTAYFKGFMFDRCQSRELS